MRLSALSVRSFVLIPAFRFFGNGFPFPGSQSWPSFPYISPFLPSQCHIGFYLPWRHSIPPDEQTSYRAAASIRRNYWQHSTPAVLELFPTTQSAAAHSSAKGFPYVPNVSRVYDLNDVNSRSWEKMWRSYDIRVSFCGERRHDIHFNAWRIWRKRNFHYIDM